MRLSLRYALASAERRPFSAESLYLEGEALRRLGRPGDSRDIFTQAGIVRFSPFTPDPRAAAQMRIKNLIELRDRFFAAGKPEKR